MPGGSALSREPAASLPWPGVHLQEPVGRRRHPQLLPGVASAHCEEILLTFPLSAFQRAKGYWPERGLCRAQRPGLGVVCEPSIFPVGLYLLAGILRHIHATRCCNEL